MNGVQPVSTEAVEHAPSASPDLSALVIGLLKGVLYREGDAAAWPGLLQLQARVRDYVSVLGLDLVLDESEGYAFLRSRDDGAEDQALRTPRLIARRPLSFPVSLLLALLRKKLAEFDAGGADTLLVLTRDQIIDMVRVFLPDTTNETRLIDQIEAHLNRIVDLGFLRRLKGPDGGDALTAYEVRRILKAFIDAQWGAEFDARLAGYQSQLAGARENAGD
jgi:hypothetical protein